MANVPQRTLSWLYSVLGKSYRDPNRTYSDCAHALSQYPSFAPRTDVYTFENGSSALLVRFVGTIPVTFRGATYRFPIALWIPYSYPQEAPLVYVTPTEEMAIRPGQHVSGDGRVYHHYLAHWGVAWDRSNLLDLLSVLSDIFAKEPPVVSKQHAPRRPPAQQQAPGPPPPVPPLPQELQGPPTPSTDPSSPQLGPPPPPPKESSRGSNGIASPGPQATNRYDVPPPLPSQPGAANGFRSMSGSSYPSGMQGRPNPNPQYMPVRNSSLRQSMSPQQIQDYSPVHRYHDNQNQDPRMTMAPPEALGTQPQPPPPHTPSYNQYRPQQESGQQRFAPEGQVSSSQYPPYTTQQQPPYPPGQQSYPPPQQQPPQPTPQHPPQQWQQPPYSQQALPHAQPKPKPAPAPNLLDSPFDISLPVSTSNLPAPPVPRNPEKDALLSTLSSTLTQNLHTAISQNSSALPALHSQHSALFAATATLTSEFESLTTLSSTLQSNISILQAALHSSNAAIAAAQSRAQKGDLPNVDEMLTAPTVVGRQLYDVVCEERGIEAAVWALQEGFVRGRISMEVWARKTRELSREAFRKRWLAEKIGWGMGLEA